MFLGTPCRASRRPSLKTDYRRVNENNEQKRAKMPKELLNLEMERDNLGQKWGFTIQGGADLALTAKVASVKVNRKLMELFETRNVRSRY